MRRSEPPPLRRLLAAFPLTEGFGIFIGIVAWKLMVEGRIEFGEGLLVALPCSLVWFGVRCWKIRRSAHSTQ
ncbi:hypothetical protein HCX48_07260 [Rhodocyclus tenuis]|uniref:Uncharacterized protein n=2 Tax=Rhodocyclus TaxID=1064 RepID=A0A6L5JY13_RHOTE|nr:hypothetical protein [Rhodocyclus gracilis]MQY51722.1 hypothetical protein [Rhodocyclus gracilis]NJA89017.1 hypothetical protein [Rhodocyclus gracilis]